MFDLISTTGQTYYQFSMEDIRQGLYIMVDDKNSVGTHKNFLRSSLYDISDNKHRNFHKKNFPHRSKIYTHNIDMFFLMTPDRILVVHDHEFCVI